METLVSHHLDTEAYTFGFWIRISFEFECNSFKHVKTSSDFSIWVCCRPIAFIFYRTTSWRSLNHILFCLTFYFKLTETISFNKFCKKKMIKVDSLNFKLILSMEKGTQLVLPCAEWKPHGIKQNKIYSYIK